uniref:inactive protein kinase SELMODRAFT_444075-like n=1 Tax=Erigeron canadensis TaxID=72917 RepID=UPI001CB98307|nr:inactive protein kinase SELMODRAFT_444075-like [Erigeron canadensis]
MEGETMKNDNQRVVLVHDASGGVKTNAVRWILEGFKLKAGDIFTFLSVLHQVHHPMGIKIRVDNSMFGGTNQKIIDDEIAWKKKEYDDNLELVQISKLYEMQEIEFKIELVVGPIPKVAAVEASKKCNPTWVILDRRMKRERKYFLEKLSCGISRMKRNDEIIKIRGPRISTVSHTKISYDEMLPVDHEFHTRDNQNDQDLFSIELSSCTSSTSTRNSVSDGILTLGNSQDDKIKQLSTLLETIEKEHESPSTETSRESTQTPRMSIEKIQFDQKKCTTCNITRPTKVWQSRNFSYSEIVEATNRFSSENLIYRGEYEAVFSGKLKRSKLNVIVKQQKDIKKYSSEMQALEKTRHENVIMLLGICVEKIPVLMVYEYACNGSLDQHLSCK